MMKEGVVTEVRILRTKLGTVSGYFDDLQALVDSVERYNGQHDIYVTINPINPALLSRSRNRLQQRVKQTTADSDIARLKRILVDIDPVRASGISSSTEEKKAALELLKEIRQDLIELGFPKPIVCDSGNGYHLIFAIDFENIAENVQLVKQFLAALDFLYSTEKVLVDTTTYNPSRISKLYGTMACKGDDSPDRPHRWSKIIKVPEVINPVTVEQIQSIADQMPKLKKKPSKRKKQGTELIDMEAWLKKYDLEVALKAPFHNNATKYILQDCPWNSDHTNQSAYVIQFENGAIAAGCHHNSCQNENWQTLRKLFEPEENGDTAGESNQSDNMIRLAKDCKYFQSDAGEPHVAVMIKGHWEVMEVKSQRCKLYLTKLYYEETDSAPDGDALNRVLKVLEMKAVFSENQWKLQRRIAKVGNVYYYDLCDPNWRTVKINQEGYLIEENPPILFTRSKNMNQQVEPDSIIGPQHLTYLITKHFQFKKEEDTILFTTYLVCCFLPQIAHAILVLFGEKGAAKSTTMRMIKRIVDPAKQDLLSMPTSKEDLAIVLSNNYMPCFDNLDSLSAQKSDILCMAATGGAFSKRTLYSDSDETILSFKRCVGLNGINVVATRPDLLDRSIVLELERISKTERKTEKMIWQSFEEDMPQFLGAIFNTLSQAIPLYDSVEIDQVGRMADFTYWGYAIAEVLGIGGGAFLKAYLRNQDQANEEALASHPVAAGVMALMKGRKQWAGSVSALLRELENMADNERINTRVRTWPKDPSVLSKRLKEVKSNLEEIGIYYDIRHAGDYKKITIEKKANESDSGALQTCPVLQIVENEEVDDGFDKLFK